MGIITASGAIVNTPIRSICHDFSPALGHRQPLMRLAQPMLVDRPHAPAELATFGRYSVIVVSPSRTLEKRTGVELLHMPDGRALISFDRSMTIAGLELLIEDALEDKSLQPADRHIFVAIGTILKSARRSDSVVLLQRTVIVLETRRAPAAIRRISK